MGPAAFFLKAAFGAGDFVIGIRDPSSKDSEALMGTLTMRAGGIVTSGDYERYVTIAGKPYSHSIDQMEEPHKTEQNVWQDSIIFCSCSLCAHLDLNVPWEDTMF